MINRIRIPNLLSHLIFTSIIVFLYLFLKNIPLNGIDICSNGENLFSLNDLLNITVGSSKDNYYVMSLGITPYIFSSLCVQIFLAFKNEKSRSRISQKKTNRIIVFLSFIISVFMSVLTLKKFDTLQLENFIKVLIVLELIAGSSFAQWMIIKNKEHGVGGVSPIIISNIIDSLLLQLKERTVTDLLVVLGISVFTSLLVVFMETKEKRFSLQRISIHNALSDKNYLSIKYNPIGVMPIMFTSAFYVLLQFFIVFLSILFPHNSVFIILSKNLQLFTTLGIVSYLLLLIITTILFSFVFVNPSLITEQLLQNGDSIINIPSGKKTKRYLKLQILKYSIFSGILLCLCVGLPFLLQMNNFLNSSITMIPTSFMILSSIFCNLIQECYAIHCYDSYTDFL